MPKLRKSKKSTKSTPLISIKKLQKQCEEAWKAVILERDGSSCKVKEFFPNLETSHTNIFQADHCISRKNKLLFLNTANGTMICSSCNRSKGFNNKSIHRAVDEIVKARIGLEAFATLVDIDMAKSINHNWNKRWWLEEQLERLTREREELIRRREIRNNPGATGVTQLINPCLDVASSGDCGTDCSEE